MGAKPFDFDPFKLTGVKVAKANREQALEEAAEYVKEKILQNCGDGKTSVAGGRWVKSLTPKYAEQKKEYSTVGYANLELHGDMLDSLDVFPKNSRSIRIEVGSDQRDKAEGHLTGVYGNSSKVRPRQFMPQDGEELSPEIVRGIREILERYEEE